MLKDIHYYALSIINQNHNLLSSQGVQPYLSYGETKLDIFSLFSSLPTKLGITVFEQATNAY